jgi:hypothetical protein
MDPLKKPTKAEKGGNAELKTLKQLQQFDLEWYDIETNVSHKMDVLVAPI